MGWSSGFSQQLKITFQDKMINMKCLLLVIVYCGAIEGQSLFSTPIRSPFGQSSLSPWGLRGAASVNPSSSSFGSLGPNLGPYNNGLLRRRCPVCDSSVYGYCNEKLFHDSCCCSDPNNPYEQLPYQCQYADCSFLHANSCREHKLITACCCTNLLLYK